MTDELYINGSLVDTEDIEIVRTYKTPFFSDATELKNDGTLTIRLPKTARNTAVFEACFRTDFVSDLPYDYLYADYYFNGLLMFKNAEVRILNVDTNIEIQCVYGINRELIVPLFETKLNEITINESTITSDNWVVDWSFNGIDASGKKYKNVYYLSGERTYDVETIGGVGQSSVMPDDIIIDSWYNMSKHPFIPSENVLDLINTFTDLSIDFSDITNRITNKGLLLSHNKSGYARSIEYTDVELLIQAQRLTIDTSNYSFMDYQNKFIFGEYDYIHLYFNFVDLYIPRKAGGSDTTCVFSIKIYNKETGELIDTNNYTGTYDSGDDSFHWDGFEFDYLSKGDTLSHTIVMEFDSAATATEANIPSTNGNQFKYEISGCFYNAIQTSGAKGIYDCIANLPQITLIEFIQQMLIHTGISLGYNSAGLLKTFSLDTFKDNLDNGDVVDWSGRVSNIRKGTFQFNDNAQKNYIKFNNDKDLKTDRKEILTVNDKTLETEKDLYVLEFDSPLGTVGEKSEMILYEQTVKRSGDTGVSFENKYVGDSWNNGFVINDAGIARNIDVVGDTYYDVYKKLTERPLVVECDVNLSIYESANVDFEKPVYCDEIGRYCLLLELQAPKYDVCVAKLLVVTQKL